MRLKWDNIGRGIADLGIGIQEGRKNREIAAIDAAKQNEYTAGYDTRQATPEEMAAYDRYNQNLAKQDAEFWKNNQTTGNNAPESDIATGNAISPQDYQYGPAQAVTGVKPGYRFMGKESAAPMTEDQIRRLKDEGIAGVMAKYGDYQGARSLRRELAQDARYAKQDQRADSAEQRAIAADSRSQQAHTQAIEKGQMELDAAKRQAESVKRMQAFGQTLADLEKQGKKPTIGEMRQLAHAQGLNDDEIHTLATRVTGLDAMEAKADANQRLKLFDEAARKGPEGLAELYDTHPLFDDGKKMTIKRGKDGVTILDGSRVVAKGGNDTEVVAYMRKYLEDPVSAVQFELDVQRVKSATRANEANAVQSYASADAQRANAAESYAGVRERNARAAQTNAETDIIRKTGVKPGSGGSSRYKVEMGEVAQALGTPAMNDDGKPITDIMTGRQVVNRNIAEEAKFFEWMKRNGITDTNEGLAKYMSGGSGQAPATGYQQYLGAFNKAKAAGNKAAMQALTEAARKKGIVK